jgi:hypothetical protein
MTQSVVDPRPQDPELEVLDPAPYPELSFHINKSKPKTSNLIIIILKMHFYRTILKAMTDLEDHLQRERVHITSRIRNRNFLKVK